MARKIPKPRRGDIVERVDFTKMFGRVVGFQTARKVRVRWADEKGVAIESIKDLALVERQPSALYRLATKPPYKKRLKKVV